MCVLTDRAEVRTRTHTIMPTAADVLRRDGERRQLAGVHRIWRRITDRGRRNLDDPL